jgi:hypothetical protein
MLVSEFNPQIIAITEVKPKNFRFPIQEEDIMIEGYTMLNNLSSPNRGIALYIDNSLNVTEIPDLNNISDDAIWCNITIPNKNSMLLGCVYRSPNNDAERNNKLNKALISASQQKHKQHIVVGDFNYPNINWDSMSTSARVESTTHKFLDTVKDTYYIQNVKEQTHQRPNQEANILDLILTRGSDTIDRLKYLAPLGASHHKALLFQTNFEVSIVQETKSQYMYNRGEYSKMKDFLQEVDWNSRLNGKLVD